MPKVLPLRSSQQAEVLQTLRELQTKAEQGLLRGLMYVVAGRDGHKTGITGSYRDNPSEAVMIATEGMKKLYQYEASKQVDPLNASPMFVQHK